MKDKLNIRCGSHENKRCLLSVFALSLSLSLMTHPQLQQDPPKSYCISAMQHHILYLQHGNNKEHLLFDVQLEKPFPQNESTPDCSKFRTVPPETNYCCSGDTFTPSLQHLHPSSCQHDSYFLFLSPTVSKYSWEDPDLKQR